jgi:hypothetical protein
MKLSTVWADNDKENQMTNRHHEDDDEFDERSVLKDGRTFRTPMYLMDDLQRAISQESHATGRDKILRNAIETDAAPMIVDAFGTTDGLNRPGYRYLHAGHQTYDHGVQVARAHMRDEAYRLHDEEESRRWRGSDREIPLKHITGDARTDAYLAREEHDTNAWRKQQG